MSRLSAAETATLFGVRLDSALFAGRKGADDLAFAQNALKGMELKDAAGLFAEYQHRRANTTAKDAAKSANIWLRSAAAVVQRFEARLPVPIASIRSDAGQERVARRFSGECINIIQNLTEGMTKPAPARTLLHEAMAPARQWGVSPVLPEWAATPTDRQLDMAASALARLQDVAWWHRQIRKVYQRHRELLAIMTGKVRRGVSPYVSHLAAMEFRASKTAQARWLAEQVVINEQYDLELSLAEAHAASVSNPENRRVELMVRMRGFEDWAAEHGHVAEFYTWTAPSKYHAWKTQKGGRRAVRNGKYRGATPRQTQKYLCEQWAKARAKLAREEIRFYGFRVVEPNHDGTPHWHLLLFVQPEHRQRLREIIEHYACEEDADELKHNRRARFDAMAIDPAIGSATGYIAKYVAKNIDGHKVGADFEAQAPANDTVTNVAAWASLWGIRQFQQVGGPAVTVWRELRRLRKAVNDPTVEVARAAADKASWSEYITAMGGIELTRKERPVQLAHLVKPCASKYGEDLKALVGVSAAGAEAIRTRLDGWEVVCRRRLATGSDERTELGLAWRQPGPWSSDNNCTGSNSGPLLAQELDRMGLDMTDYRRMVAGAIVTIDGLYCWIRNGTLNQSKKRPQFRPEREQVPPCEEAHQWEREAKQGRHDKARAVVRNDLTLDEYLQGEPRPETALKELDSVLHRERRQAPATFREDRRLVSLAGFVAEQLKLAGAADYVPA